MQRYQSCALAIPNNDRGCYYNPEDRATQERSKMRTRDGPILLFYTAYSSLYDTQDVHANLLLIPCSERGQPTIRLKLDL